MRERGCGDGVGVGVLGWAGDKGRERDGVEWEMEGTGGKGKYIPAVHIRNHVNLRLGLRNLLLRRDLWFLTEEHGHVGLKKTFFSSSCELDGYWVCDRG